MKTAEKGAVHVLVAGSSDIGAATAAILTATGARVVVTGRDRERLASVTAATGAEGHLIDATDGAAVDELLAGTAQRHGRLDGVACFAGSLLLKPAHLTTDADWQATLAANLTSAFVVLRGAARIMMRAGGGSIVLLSSAAARTGIANHEAIAAAKAGVIGLALSAAATYARQGIRVNAVAPGLTRTRMTGRITANAASLKESESMHALGRIGEPADIASAVAWLLDSGQSWVTGQVIGVDGGLATVRGRASA